MEIDLETRLTTQQVSDLTGVGKRTLDVWRKTGKGPAYEKLTAKMVRYRRGTVLEWLEQHRQGG